MKPRDAGKSHALDQFRAEGVDWVAVTGDLVDHPFDDMHSPENLERGEADLQLVRSLLERLSCPVFVLYGNHDHPLLFRRVFTMQSEGVDVGDFRVFCFYDEESADHVPVRVGAELERFDRALSRGTSTGHLQHYLVHRTQRGLSSCLCRLAQAIYQRSGQVR